MLTSKIPLQSSAALKILNSLKILWSLMSEAGFFHEKSSWNRHERDPHAHPWTYQWTNPMVSIPSMNILIWLVVGPPLWKIWVRQLGWWDSQLNGKIKHVPNHQPVIESALISKSFRSSSLNSAAASPKVVPQTAWKIDGKFRRYHVGSQHAWFIPWEILMKNNGLWLSSGYPKCLVYICIVEKTWENTVNNAIKKGINAIYLQMVNAYNGWFILWKKSYETL